MQVAYAGATIAVWQKEFVSPGERARGSYVTARPVGPAKRSPYGVNPHYLVQLVSVDVWGQTDLTEADFLAFH